MKIVILYIHIYDIKFYKKNKYTFFYVCDYYYMRTKTKFF